MTESRSLWDAPRKGPASTQWILGGSIWFGVALFDATQNVFVMRAEGMHHAWVRLFVFQFLSWLIWALATPIILLLDRRHPPFRARSLVVWLPHLLMCALIGLASASWTALLDVLIDPWASTQAPAPFIEIWFDKFFGGMLSFVILYAVILAVGRVLDSRERLALQQAETARLNGQLAKADLDALRRQIEPHFLFNALNGIAGLVREKRNDAAVGMIAAVSDLLRRVLDDSDRHLVSLGEEMEFLQKYFDVQKMRFGERLELSVDVPERLHSARVPSLILQPIAENAFKHGLARRVQGGAIRVAASQAAGMLTLSIYNDGPGLPTDSEGIETGVGFSNAGERLKSLYGERFGLTMRNCGEGVEVLLTVPLTEG